MITTILLNEEAPTLYIIIYALFSTVKRPPSLSGPGEYLRVLGVCHPDYILSEKEKKDRSFY